MCFQLGFYLLYHNFHSLVWVLTGRAFPYPNDGCSADRALLHRDCFWQEFGKSLQLFFFNYCFKKLLISKV